VPAQTRALEEGDRFKLGSLDVAILHVPGHTLGAIAYVVSDLGDGAGAPGSRAVFTGDTMFVAGCGRLFEGSPAQMFDSLRKITALPGDTRVYCGHEYTASNVRFAKTVEPDSAALAALEARAVAARERGEPTIPSTIDEERATNPFVRAKDAAELAARRAAKDAFR
jgi:hydroxyacylglutathione hydrolase